MVTREFKTDPSHVHRTGDELFSDLLGLYDKSLGGSVDWNGDTLRTLIYGILDAAHLGAPEFDAAEIRSNNQRRAFENQGPALNPGGPIGPGAYSISDVASEVVRQLRAAGLGSESQPDEARAHSLAIPSQIFDPGIPPARTVFGHGDSGEDKTGAIHGRSSGDDAASPQNNSRSGQDAEPAARPDTVHDTEKGAGGKDEPRPHTPGKK